MKKNPFDSAIPIQRRRTEALERLLQKLAVQGLQSMQYRNCADFRETVDEALALVPRRESAAISIPTAQASHREGAGDLTWDEWAQDYV